MTSFLTSQTIDVAALTLRVHDASHGAIASFVGLVRNHHGGRGVIRLEYSAYDEMVEEQAAALLDECARRWSVRLAAQHRVGTLEVGEAAVAVIAAAPHRAAAFDACRWTIDEIKRRLPIWKRETYADGDVAWVDPTSMTVPR